MKEANMLSGLAKRFGLGRGESEGTRDTLSEAKIRDWLIQRLAKQLKTDPAEIDPARSFEAYGLDSRVAVQVAGQLEKLVERRLSPALLFEHPSIDALSSFLAKEVLHEANAGAEPDMAVADGAQAP
jgi:acyl carrier protein